jgi:hypothetical protein
MTTDLEEVQAVYRLSDDLTVSTCCTSVQFSAPDEAEREDWVLKKLGAKAWGRLYQFKHYYGPGWGEGTGRSLSPRSLELFYRFLASLTLREPCKPSIFLTDDGNLEMCWEDRLGKTVQVEFTPDGIDYFIEAEETESHASNGDLPDVAKSLSAL